MNKYQEELQILKEYDEVQEVKMLKGYQFIHTAGHGYLVVPQEDKNAGLAIRICSYGYVGNEAIYLEEDSEMGEFLKRKDKTK